jgi:hypothetical protein
MEVWIRATCYVGVLPCKVALEISTIRRMLAELSLCLLFYSLNQWYSTGGMRTPGGTRRHPKILFFCHLKFII